MIDGCAAPRAGRRSTWINGRIRSLYADLFALGHCHTVEVWEGDELIGGLYGVHLGRAFFGESMFSRARDASKIALIYLVARLKFGGFELLDTQFLTGAPRPLRRDRGWARGVSAPARSSASTARGTGTGTSTAAPPALAAAFWVPEQAWAQEPEPGAGAASAAGAAACDRALAPAARAAPPPRAALAAAAGASARRRLPARCGSILVAAGGAAGSFVLQLVSQTSKTGCSTA